MYWSASTADMMMSANAVMRLYVYTATTDIKAVVLCVFALADGVADAA